MMKNKKNHLYKMRMCSLSVFAWWEANVSIQQNSTDNSEMDSARVLTSIYSLSAALFTDICLVWRSKVRAHIILPTLAFAHIYTHTIVDGKIDFYFYPLGSSDFFSFYFALSRSAGNTIKTHCTSTCYATRFDSYQNCLWHHHDIRYALSKCYTLRNFSTSMYPYTVIYFTYFIIWIPFNWCSLYVWIHRTSNSIQFQFILYNC